MLEENNNLNSKDDILMSDLFKILYANFKFIFILSIILFFVSIFYSLSISDKFESESLVKFQSAQNNKESESLEAFSAVLGYSNMSSDSDKNEVLAVLQSKKFLTEFVKKNNLYNTFDETITNNETNLILDDETLEKDENFLNYKKFRNSLFIEENIKTGLIKIKFIDDSPYKAKEVLVNLLNDINKFYVNQNKEESEKAIMFLEQKINLAESNKIKEIFFSMIETEYKNLILADSLKGNPFKILDPPSLNLYKVSPNRTLISILGLIFGIIISSIIVLLLNFFRIPIKINSENSDLNSSS